MNKGKAAKKCVFELRGWSELITPGRRAGNGPQSFSLLATETAAFVEFDLPKSRARALRLLDKGYFNSRIMKADRISWSPRPVNFDHLHMYFFGDPERKKTWREAREGEYPGDAAGRETKTIRNFISARNAVIGVEITFSDGKKLRFAFAGSKKTGTARATLRQVLTNETIE